MRLISEKDFGMAIREMMASSPGLRRIFPTLTAPSFARDLKRCWRILEGQVTQGFIMERKPDERFVQFGSTEILIAVHPAHRRQGVATWAVKRLLESLDDAFLIVSPGNKAAHALFSVMKGLKQIQESPEARVFTQTGDLAKR